MKASTALNGGSKAPVSLCKDSLGNRPWPKKARKPKFARLMSLSLEAAIYINWAPASASSERSPRLSAT